VLVVGLNMLVLEPFFRIYWILIYMMDKPGITAQNERCASLNGFESYQGFRF
jgi:hypothetical protein